MGRYTKDNASKRYSQDSGQIPQGIPLIIVILLMLSAAAGGYFVRPIVDEMTGEETNLTTTYIPSKPKAQPAAQVEQTPQPTATETLQTLPPTEAEALLPELGSSDAPVREALSQAAPGLKSWLDTDQVIRSYMLIANDISQGQRTYKHLRWLAPKLGQPFTAEQNGAELTISEASYLRYTPLAEAVDSIDVVGALAVYKKFKPLLAQELKELGYPPEHTVEGLLAKAAAEILAAESIIEPIALTKYASRYKFADPKLEALNPVQKQLLRMGPENMRLIQDKVRFLAAGLAGLNEQ